MEMKEYIREQILEKIKNPFEAKSIYVRLGKQGFNDFQNKKMIGKCILEELFELFRGALKNVILLSSGFHTKN